jgi:hypothetical protein
MRLDQTSDLWWKPLVEERRRSGELEPDGTPKVELDAYGYLWLRIRRAEERALT